MNDIAKTVTVGITLYVSAKLLVDFLLGPQTKENEMGKLETVSAQKAALLAGQDSLLDAGLGACYDQGAADQKSSDGTLTQADLDAAVKKATDPLNAQLLVLSQQVSDDAKALSDAQAKAQADLALVQKALDDMTAKEQLEEKAVKDVQDSVNKVQASFDAIKAILFPAPPPPPVSAKA